MADKYSSTLLPQSADPLEIQKAVLDLLKKINEIAGGGAASVPTGAIQMWGKAEAPEGYLLCDGASVERAAYGALYAVIGDTFGSVDAAHFSVPDFRGVSPTGVGAQDINGRTKTGPNLGEVREDVTQEHRHLGGTDHDQNVYNFYGTVNNSGTRYRGEFTSVTVGSQHYTSATQEQSGYGTPRTGAYTHGPEIGVHFIIRY